MSSASQGSNKNVNKPQSAKPVPDAKKKMQKPLPIVDSKQLENVFLELRLKMQVKGFHSNQIKDYFFKPYNSEEKVTLVKLRNMFENNGLPANKSELLARYILEPRDQPEVYLQTDRSATQRNIIAVLEESIGHYKVYSSADTQNCVKKIQKLLQTCKDTLKETLELEDYDYEKAIPVSAFKEAFETLDIDIEDELLDFIFYVIYQKSESIDKMQYLVLFDLIEGKLPGLNATSSEGGRKRPESSSPEKLKARNKEKFSGSQGTANDADAAKQASKASAKGGKTVPKQERDGDDNYEDEFEQLLDKDDEEGEYDDSHAGKLKRTSEEEVNREISKINEKSVKEEERDEKEEGAEVEDDDYIDEEEMLDIAERCFVRIAEAILDAGISVRQAF